MPRGKEAIQVIVMLDDGTKLIVEGDDASTAADAMEAAGAFDYLEWREE